MIDPTRQNADLMSPTYLLGRQLPTRAIMPCGLLAHKAACSTFTSHRSLASRKASCGWRAHSCTTVLSGYHSNRQYLFLLQLPNAVCILPARLNMDYPAQGQDVFALAPNLPFSIQSWLVLSPPRIGSSPQTFLDLPPSFHYHQPEQLAERPITQLCTRTLSVAMPVSDSVKGILPVPSSKPVKEGAAVRWHH